MRLGWGWNLWDLLLRVDGLLLDRGGLILLRLGGCRGWVAVEAGGCFLLGASELATDGSSLKPGLLRPLSICIAADAACLVVISACREGAG